MTEPIKTDSETSSIRKLTIAVWILCILTTINICLSLFGAFFSGAVTKHTRDSLRNDAFPSSTATYEDQYKDFHEWTLEQQIQKASVIAIARYEKENGRLKCVISEILKQAPGTRFYYKVGTEYRPGSLYPRKDTVYGDGQVIFFTGSPASMRYSCSFEGDRIGGLGDMPIEMLREAIRKAKIPNHQ